MAKGKSEVVKPAKLTQQEAIAKIAELLKQADKHLTEAANIAEEYAVDFQWRGPEGSYGLGGSYNPASAWNPSSGCEWEQSDSEERGWISSSSDC